MGSILRQILMLASFFVVGAALYGVDRLIDRWLNPGRKYPTQHWRGVFTFWWTFVWAMAAGAVVGTVESLQKQAWGRAAFGVLGSALLVACAVLAFKVRFRSRRQ